MNSKQIEQWRISLKNDDWISTEVDELCDLALRGLERGKEPVALLLPEDSINDIQAESIKQLISRAKHAHYVDVKIRINGQDEHYQADWLKHLQLSAPPAASGTVQVPRKHLEHLRDDHPLLEHLVRQWASEMLSAAPEVKP